MTPEDKEAYWWLSGFLNQSSNGSWGIHTCHDNDGLKSVVIESSAFSLDRMEYSSVVDAWEDIRVLQNSL